MFTGSDPDPHGGILFILFVYFRCLCVAISISRLLGAVISLPNYESLGTSFNPGPGSWRAAHSPIQNGHT